MDFKLALQLILGLFFFLLTIVILSILDREHANGCAPTDRFFRPSEINKTTDQPVTLASDKFDALVSFSGFFLNYDSLNYSYYSKLPLKLQMVNLNDIFPNQKLLTLSSFCSKIAIILRNDTSENKRKVDLIQVKLALGKRTSQDGFEEDPYVCIIKPEEVLTSHLEAHFACKRKLTFDCRARNNSDGSPGYLMGQLILESFEFQVDQVDRNLASRNEFSTPKEACNLHGIDELNQSEL